MLRSGTQLINISPTAETVTPSGLEIRYYSKPKRKYEIRRYGHLGGSDPWQEIPSVTDILKVLDKPQLIWWGMKMGVEGLAKIYRFDPTGLVSREMEDLLTDSLVERLADARLTVNHLAGQASNRGISVHQALEAWMSEGRVPKEGDYAQENRGFIRGLARFLSDIQVVPDGSEIMVGSLEHGFAGRYDARIRVEEECEVVFKNTPVRGAHTAILKPGTYLVDLKTGKDVYPHTHYRQLEAYELASVECGYEPTDYRAVLQVSEDGKYQFARSTATAEDFLCVLEVYKSNKRIK